MSRLTEGCIIVVTASGLYPRWNRSNQNISLSRGDYGRFVRVAAHADLDCDIASGKMSDNFRLCRMFGVDYVENDTEIVDGDCTGDYVGIVTERHLALTKDGECLVWIPRALIERFKFQEHGDPFIQLHPPKWVRVPWPPRSAIIR